MDRSRAGTATLLIAAAVAMVVAGASRVDAQAADPRFTLTGVVVVEGQAGRAWLQEPSLTQNQVVSVRTGETIGMYRLTNVFDDRVELDGPAGVVTVFLTGPTAGSATPPFNFGSIFGVTPNVGELPPARQP